MVAVAAIAAGLALLTWPALRTIRRQVQSGRRGLTTTRGSRTQPAPGTASLDAVRRCCPYKEAHGRRSGWRQSRTDSELRATIEITATFQYLVGRTAFHFIVEDGSIQLHYGQAQNPAVTLTTDEETWADIASGQTTASAAAAAGALTLVGDPRAVTRLGKIFSRSRVLGQANEIIEHSR
jgi:putative sterol carrier protein